VDPWGIKSLFKIRNLAVSKAIFVSPDSGQIEKKLNIWPG
jgi:hypothetical protein